VKRKTKNLRNPTETKQEKKKKKLYAASNSPQNKIIIKIPTHHSGQGERMQLNSNSNQSLMISAHHDNINLCLRT
jgi:hypothetical protein